MKTNMDPVQSGWSPRANEEVPELRRAITAQMDEKMVASPMAPMMGELLTRLEGFSNPRDVGELNPPEPPAGEGPITHGEANAALHEACGVVKQQAMSSGANQQVASALQGMAEVIENHLSMKGEVISRST